jgi:hypothetical protein
LFTQVVGEDEVRSSEWFNKGVEDRMPLPCKVAPKGRHNGSPLLLLSLDAVDSTI